MRYLSVCSGIEAATAAWHPLGWEPVAFSEVDAFPSAVLKHHYPSVPNWGDMTKFQEWLDADVDVLVGGTPCQSFSVAGLRKGLDDPRGNLMLTYLAIARRYRPRPKARGGNDSIGNLRWTCEAVNIAKRDMTDAEFLALCGECMHWIGTRIQMVEEL